jgi:hypothetical protein
MLVSSKGAVPGRSFVYRRVSIARSTAARARATALCHSDAQRQPAEVDKAADGTPPDPHLLRVIARLGLAVVVGSRGCRNDQGTAVALIRRRHCALSLDRLAAVAVGAAHRAARHYP